MLKREVGLSLLEAVLWRLSVPVVSLIMGIGFSSVGSASPVSDSLPREFQVFRKPMDANDLRMVGFDGRLMSLTDLKGRVVLLNFWRKNCPYCEREKTYLKKMALAVNSPNLVVLCANFWDDPLWIRRYATGNGGDLVFAAKLDDEQSVIKNEVRGRLVGFFIVNRLKEAIYEVKGFPSTYVIDRRGKVIAAHMGMARWDRPSVRRWISGLTADDSSTTSVVDAEYELPSWMDRLLSHPLEQLPEWIHNPSIQKAGGSGDH